MTCATSRSARCGRQLGIVPQEAFLFAGSVARQQSRFGRPDASFEDVVAAAHRGGGGRVHPRAAGRVRRGDRGARRGRLSIGQRQLVAFARGAACETRTLLILDEATSSVDIPDRGQDRAGRWNTLLQHRTSFVVAHRLSTIRRADLIIVLEHGEGDRDGKRTNQLIALRGRYFAL